MNENIMEELKIAMEAGDEFLKKIKDLSVVTGQSILCTLIDRYCFEHDMDECETWETFYNLHKEVNDELGDYHEKETA